VDCRTGPEDALKDEVDSSHRYVRLAAAVVITFSVGMPLVNVVAFVIVDGWPSGQAVVFLVATALYMPIHVRLVWGATRGRPPARAGWLLAVEAVIILAAVPLAGDTWLRSFTPLAFAVLAVLRPPWSVIAFLGLALAPFPLTAVLGQQPWLAVSAATGVGSALGLYALLWIMEAIRRLQSARALLASEAVSMERLRIDDELRRTVSADLASIIATAERASTSFARGRRCIERWQDRGRLER
jgi:hypothetical protein